MVNYYRRFLARTDEMNQSFSNAKKAMASVTVLAHPVPSDKIKLCVDALAFHVCGVMEQVIHGRPQPLTIFSRKLVPAENCYSTFDRELLLIYSAIRHFQFLLKGRSFCMYVH